jgi:hypothetical protein
MMRTVLPSFTRILVALGVLWAGSASVARAAADPPGDPHCSVEQGQAFINDGRFDRAIREFTCVIDAQPTEVDGYRGRIEAALLLGRFSDAVRDYTRVTAFVLPVHPDAEDTIVAGYSARLATSPQSISALTGLSFARWWFFEYGPAIQLTDQILALLPNDVYGNTFNGSSRLLKGVTMSRGVATLERALALAPQSPDVHYLASDAYTYGLSDPERAFAEATLALNGGLDTPRVHAILAASYLAFGNQLAAAAEIKRHLDLVTTELVATAPIPAGISLTLDLVPGRTFEVPVVAIAGQAISITTDSPTREISDTILVLLSPNGTPVVGSDDYKKYFAGFVWPAQETGVYRLRVTSFESVNTGALGVTRR